MKNKTKMTTLLLTLSTLSAVQAVESTPDSSQGQTERSSGKRVAESDVMQIINESLGGPSELKRLHRPSRQKILTGQKGCKLNMREVNNIEVIRDRINNYVKARPNLNKIELDLSENRLNDEEFERLCKILPEMKHLQKLDVSENNIGDEGVIALASELPKSLRALYLSGNNITAEGLLELIKRLKEQKINLQALDLSKNNIGDEGVIALASELPKSLRALYLSRNNISCEGVIALVNAVPKSLQKLDLSGNNIQGMGAIGLAKQVFSRMKNLQKLYLGGNNIGYWGIRALIEEVPRMKNLQKLDLSGNNIGDEGVIALAEQVSKMENLQALYLSRNNISCEGVTFLAHGLPEGLKTLDVGGNNIGDRGAIDLADNLPESLQALNVAYNDITAEGFLRLFTQLEAQEIKLKKLNISGNRLINSSLDEIRKALNSMHDMLRHLQSSVEELDMHDVDLVGEGGYLLSSLQGSRILKKVNISKCGITGDNAIPILRILATTAIEDLNISRNNFDYPAFLLTEGQGFLDFCSQLSEMENLKIFDVSHGCLVTTQLIEIIQNLPESIQVLCMNNNEPRKDWNERLTLLRQIYDRFPGLDCRNLVHNHTRTNAEILILRLSEKENLKTIYADNVSGDSYWRGWDLSPEQKAKERDLDRDFNNRFKTQLRRELSDKVEVK